MVGLPTRRITFDCDNVTFDRPALVVAYSCGAEHEYSRVVAETGFEADFRGERVRPIGLRLQRADIWSVELYLDVVCKYQPYSVANGRFGRSSEWIRFSKDGSRTDISLPNVIHSASNRERPGFGVPWQTP